MSSSSISDDDDSHEGRPTREIPHRVARKSTTQQPPPKYTTRRVNHMNSMHNKSKELLRFIENFNPETSAREKRKLSRKINPPTNVRRPPGALYDEHGVHIATYSDLCDCLNENCPGCFFPCPKCGSSKCGIDCRVHRKYVYDQIEYHGYDIVVKNPLLK